MSDSVKKKTSIQSVERAAQILLAIAAERAGLTAQDVSSRFGLTLSTAYHLLSTLTSERLLAKVEGKRYVLGAGSAEIANAVAQELRPPQAQLLALDRLADVTGESTYLSAWHLGGIRIVANVEGSQAVRVAGLDVGFAGSIHARASSKLLLAFADEGLRDNVLDGYEFTQYTANTITSRSQLDLELSAIRKEGIARDRGEFNADVYTVSAPIRDPDGSIRSAIAVSAPMSRFASREKGILDALRTEAAAISSRSKFSL